MWAIRNVILPPTCTGKLDVAVRLVVVSYGVIKDLGLKEPYLGQCANCRPARSPNDLTYYFATSEQVPSSVGLGVLMEP
ncbi:MAG: Hsp33 family molecular chaperone HslO [Lacrimispora saccharolytica]